MEIPRTTLIMAINMRVKYFGPWKNKIASPMTMSKKGQSATLALLTYELFLIIGAKLHDNNTCKIILRKKKGKLQSFCKL